MATQKITLSIEPEILKCFKTMFSGNISKMVQGMMVEYIKTTTKPDEIGNFTALEQAFRAGQDTAIEIIRQKLVKAQRKIT